MNAPEFSQTHYPFFFSRERAILMGEVSTNNLRVSHGTLQLFTFPNHLREKGSSGFRTDPEEPE